MLLCLSSSLFFSYASDICAAIDLSSLSSFWMDSIAIESFVSHQIGDYCLSYKLFYGGNASDEFNYLEFAADLCAYPIENSGFKVGLSIVKAGLFWGMGAQDLKPILSSETFVSWEIKFSNLYKFNVLVCDRFSTLNSIFHADNFASTASLLCDGRNSNKADDSCQYKA